MTRAGEEFGRGQTVAVFGSSRRDEGTPFYVEAHELGRLLARRGYAVLSGGYGGSMAAVSRGAAEAGGRVIGVTCAIFDPLPPNPWLSEEIKTADLMERLAVMMRSSDAFIAARGGIGTLSELTLVWSMIQTRSIRDKPLVLLGADWTQVIDAWRQYTDMGNTISALAHIAATPAEAVALLASLDASPSPLGPPPLG
jgi:uncharacterized protein (TIGR00730 family)